MTSAIVYSTVDEDFPVAGVDNDSQGFRDNFTVIKTGLQTANSEITNLQTYSAKLGNDAGTEVVNDFGGNVISNAKTSRVYANAYNTYVTSNTNISWNDGEYQAIEVRGDYKLTFTDWPEADGYGKMRIELKSNGSARTVTFAAGSGYSLKKEIGTALVTATGAVRNAGTGSVATTQFSFPTGSFTTVTGAGFQIGNLLTGTGLTNDVLISAVDNITTSATATVATLTINYTDIVTGTDTVVSMAASVSSITDGDPITLPNVTGVGQLSISQVYYVYKDGGGNIKLSTTQSTYTAIVSSGTYTGGTQAATFRQSANSNRVTVGDSTKMYVNMPIRFTGTAFGGVSADTDYYVHSIIDTTGIRLSLTSGGVPITLTSASGTLTIVPRTVLTTTFNSQTVTAGTGLILSTNIQGVPTPFTLDADPTKIRIIEVWKQPYEDIVFLKYLGEFA